MSLIETMKQLYASEINCGMESFWDGGFTVWIGNASLLNGVFPDDLVTSETFEIDELFPQAAQWLANAAIEKYPDSNFAKMYG